MMDALLLKAILNTVQREFAQVLGGRLDRVFLFGSHARGTASPDSDIAILVVIKDDFDYADLIRRTSPIVAQLSFQHDVVISRAFIPAAPFESGQDPFARNVRREAVPI